MNVHPSRSEQVDLPCLELGKLTLQVPHVCAYDALGGAYLVDGGEPVAIIPMPLPLRVISLHTPQVACVVTELLSCFDCGFVEVTHGSSPVWVVVSTLDMEWNSGEASPCRFFEKTLG